MKSHGNKVMVWARNKVTRNKSQVQFVYFFIIKFLHIFNKNNNNKVP